MGLSEEDVRSVLVSHGGRILQKDLVKALKPQLASMTKGSSFLLLQEKLSQDLPALSIDFLATRS